MCDYNCSQKDYEGKKPFNCKNCDYRSSQKGELNKHVPIIHEGMKSFKCKMCGYCFSQRVHEGQKPFKCKNCDYRSSQKGELNKHVSTMHKGIKSFKCKMCAYCCSQRVHEGQKPFKCENCDYRSSQKGELNKHVSTIHEGMKPCERKITESLRIGSLNIGTGLYAKEELLINTIQEQKCDIIGISEVDIEYFDEKNPFSIKGYKTFFPLQRPGTSTKRLLCFVKDTKEVTQRNDLMSNLLSNVWLKVKAKNQKILINFIYREFSDLTSKGQMTINEQLERLKILHSQIEKATNEGLIL